MREVMIQKEGKVFRFNTYSRYESDGELLVLVNADIREVKEEIDNLSKALRVLAKRKRELKLLEEFKACVERDIKKALEVERKEEELNNG